MIEVNAEVFNELFKPKEDEEMVEGAIEEEKG